MEFKRRKRPAGSKSNTATPTAGGSPEPEQEQDEETPNLEDLVALRKIKRAVGGIDLERLNEGDRKRRRRKIDDDTYINEDGTIEAAAGGIKKDRVKDREEDDPLDPLAETRRLVKRDNFTGQTNAVDVDKHMMAYIETEMRKRKGETETETKKNMDPHEMLYEISDKYNLKKHQISEGNVTLSAAMLTAIPEVDLGIDSRLRNIEATEMAKRALQEQKSSKPLENDKNDSASGLATDRFWMGRKREENNKDALEKARKEAAGIAEEKRDYRGPRREFATDDQVLDRFKKRQAGKR